MAEEGERRVVRQFEQTLQPAVFQRDERRGDRRDRALFGRTHIHQCDGAGAGAAVGIGDGEIAEGHGN
jgi:hypothetical protein